VDVVRACFPSLHVGNCVFMDNPGGTQVAQRVIDRTTGYFTRSNANTGGYFATSVESDDLLAQAHAAAADLLGASSGDEIVFGQNMTSLTFSISRSIARELNPGDEIVVTRMDHDGNISPWLMMAEDRGVTVRWLDFNRETFRYDLEDLDRLLTPRTRLVAVNYASNALGTVNDVRAVTERAHAVGAWVYVDAVQYVPHGVTDVQAIGCDFLACSPYKFYGPHQGVVWGRRELLERLTPYKVRPASNRLPTRFETGTLSHEGMAGTLGAIEHLAWVGETMGFAAPAMGSDVQPDHTGTGPGTPDPVRRRHIEAAFHAIEEHERAVFRKLLDGLHAIPGVTVYGPGHDNRVPTVALTKSGVTPEQMARHLGRHDIFSWDGHYYAIEVVRRLGLDRQGGMLRLGLAQYNTFDEVDRVLNALTDL
jgi:cysteine desulfurase family protein (TIGR01976 family)